MDSKTLALYLGCEAMHGNKKIIVCGLNINSGYIQNIANEETIPINDLKLLLRPLSNITYEENLFLYKGREFNRAFKSIENEAEKTRYLLSRGFDLFGLIEKGEALDATKVEKDSHGVDKDK